MTGDGVRVTKTSAPVPGAAYDLDALRLLRLVHLRRALRALVGVELLAIVVWAAYSLSMEAYYEEGSTNWQRIDDETGPGFVVILVALVATVAVLLVSGRLGRHGAVAKKLVPGFNGTAEPAVRPRDAAPAVRSRLRRRGFVQGAAVGLVLLFGLLAVMTGTSAWPAWQANHGHGGHVITIDEYDYVTSHDNGPRPDTWILGTGDGTAVAESGRPRIGQRWTVGRDIFGNLRAYRVGGYDYVLVGGMFLLSVVVVLGAVAYQATAVRKELRLRRAAGDHDLAADVSRLASGARPELLLNGKPTGILGLPERAGHDAARTLLVRRLVTGGITTVVAVGLVVLLVVQQLNLLSGPPFKRDVQLPYVTSAGFERLASVQYRFQDSNIRDLREWAADDADKITGVRGIDLDPTPPDDSFAPRPSTVDITIARVGSVPAARLDAGFRAEYTTPGYRVTEVDGLATGWTGLYRVYPKYGDGELHAFWASDEVSIEIELDDFYLDDNDRKHYTSAELVRIIAPLTRALTRVGAQRLEKDTARPAHV